MYFESLPFRTGWPRDSANVSARVSTALCFVFVWSGNRGGGEEEERGGGGGEKEGVIQTHCPIKKQQSKYLPQSVIALPYADVLSTKMF